MEENFSYIKSLIIGSITGENSESDEQVLNDWMAEDEERRLLVGRYRDAGSNPRGQIPPELNKEECWRLIQEKLAAIPGAPHLPELKHKEWIGYETPRRPAVIRILRPWWRAVAVALFGFILVYSLVASLLNFKSAKNQVLLAATQIASIYINQREVPLSAGVSQTLYHTDNISVVQEDQKVSFKKFTADHHPPTEKKKDEFRVRSRPGKKFEVNMPDNSSVYMDAASSVRFTSDYGTGQRNIQLEKGAAFFVVSPTTPTENIPFVVQVNNTTFTARGTQFNIEAYSIDSSVRATLVTGHLLVKRESEADSIALQPGEIYVLNPNGTHTVEKTADSSYVVPWRRKKFSFTGQPLSHILEELGRHYGVTIKWIGPPSDEQTDMSNPMSEPLPKLLEQLKGSSSHKIDYKIEHDTVLVWQCSDTTTINPAVRD